MARNRVLFAYYLDLWELSIDMFRAFGRLLSFSRLYRPSLRLIPLSLAIVFIELRRQSKPIYLIEQQDLQPQPEEPAFKITQYSDTLYELRKDIDDFIIITNVAHFNQYLKKTILMIVQKLYINSIKNGKRLRVMYIEPEDKATERSLEEKNNLKIKKDVIFLIKNKYSQKLEPFTIEELADNMAGLETYFQPIVASGRDEIRAAMEKLDENEALLLYVGDNFDAGKLQQSQKKFKRMERAVFNQKKNIRFLFVDKEDELKAVGITDTTPSHSHLILKSSHQSIVEPNLSHNLKNYHLMSNIQLYDKEGRLELDEYIDQVHTFSDNLKRYNLMLKIDKNYIDPDKAEQIVQALREVKKQGGPSNVSYQVMFKEMDTPEAWSIEIVDLDKLSQDNNKYLNGIKDVSQLQNVGRHTHRYRLQAIPTKQNIQAFITSVLSGQAHQYFASQQPKVVNSLHKITGNTFNKHVLQDGKHHLVFQYSEYCQACKELAPILVKFNTMNSNHSIETHRLSEQNVVKGQIIYPYSPVLLFYKHDWKPNPIQIPTEAIAKQSKNLKTYCEILAEVDTVDEQQLQKHYFQAANLDWSNLPFKLL